jgi:hypothetical protein
MISREFYDDRVREAAKAIKRAWEEREGLKSEQKRIEDLEVELQKAREEKRGAETPTRRP